MLNLNKKNFAYMLFKNNEFGYSLFSMLLALSVFTLTIPFLSTLIINVHYETNYNDISVHHFFYMIHDQLLHSKTYDVRRNKLYLQQNLDEMITIEKYGTLIRRQVDGSGHEIYLRNVKDVTFKKLPYGIHITIILTSGELYEKTVAFYK